MESPRRLLGRAKKEHPPEYECASKGEDQESKSIAVVQLARGSIAIVGGLNWMTYRPRGAIRDHLQRCME